MAIKKDKVKNFQLWSFFFGIFLIFTNNTIGGDKITFKYRYRKQIIIIVLIIIAVTLSTGTIIYLNSNNKKEIKIEPANSLISKKNTLEEKEEKQQYKVDIKGEIISPGIYTLDIDSRVIDVINMAGGLSENANTTVINLSKKITDEMVIIIYSNEEVANFKKTKEIEKQVIKQCEQKDENSLINSACINISTETNISSSTISLNTATKEELMTLSGIGEAKAEEIIKYRSEHNGFTSIEELKEIPGIGENIFAKIKDNITL